MVKFLNESENCKMVKWCYVNMVRSCNSVFLGQTYNTSRFISFYKHLENSRGHNLPDSHALKKNIESITEEVTQLCQYNK